MSTAPAHQLCAMPLTALEALQAPERAALAARLRALDLELAVLPADGGAGRLLRPWTTYEPGPGPLAAEQDRWPAAEMAAVVRGPSSAPVSVWRNVSPGGRAWHVSASSGAGLPFRRELGPAPDGSSWDVYRREAEQVARAAGWEPPLHPADLRAALEAPEVRALLGRTGLVPTLEADALRGEVCWLSLAGPRCAWLEARHHAVRLVLDHMTLSDLLPTTTLVYSLPLALEAAALFLRG